jgi:hypothetical protein
MPTGAETMQERADTTGANLTQPGSPDVHGWQPIKSAPKDGSWIIGLEFFPEPTIVYECFRVDGRHAHIGGWRWNEDHRAWDDEEGMADGDYEPSLWMPIPPLPPDKQGDGQ